MVKFKVLLCMLLGASIVFSLAACKDSREISDSESAQDNNLYRAEYVLDDKNTEFIDTDGSFEYKTVDFDGPEGYTIVFPAGNIQNKKSAEALAKYYKESLSVELKVVDDNADETEKEILIGKTSREQSNKGKRIKGIFKRYKIGF